MLGKQTEPLTGVFISVQRFTWCTESLWSLQIAALLSWLGRTQ